MVQPNTRIYEEERNEMCPLLPPPQKKKKKKKLLHLMYKFHWNNFQFKKKKKLKNIPKSVNE